jgi:hypothetical protein
VLQVRTPEGETLEKPLGAIRQAPVAFDVGGGHMHIDLAKYQPAPEFTQTRFERLCESIRRAVLTYYSSIFVPVLTAGLLAFLLASVKCFRRALLDPCYILASACWLLALVRTSLLVLIDVTSFPAIFPFYLAPANFMLVSAALLSIAAFYHLVRADPAARTLIAGLRSRMCVASR